MPNFFKISQQKLNTCHHNLVFLFEAVVKEYDCTILVGMRSDAKQNELYKAGRSKKKGGKSKHNQSPSLAVDVSPYPIPKDWGQKDVKELARFYHFVGYVKATADMLGIKIRCGADWNGNKIFNDQGFDDLVHFELV